MSEKASEVLTKIHQLHGNVYSLEWYFYVITVFTMTTFLISFLGYSNSVVPLYLALISIILSLISLGVIAYLLNKKRKSINKRRKSVNLVKKMEQELDKIQVTKIEQFDIIIEEIDTVDHKFKETLSTTYQNVSKLFFFVFWVPSGFFIVYYFNNSDEMIFFSQTIDLIMSLLVIAFQLIFILSILTIWQNDLISMFNYEKRKREIARKYLFDLKLLKLYKQS